MVLAVVLRPGSSQSGNFDYSLSLGSRRLMRPRRTERKAPERKLLIPFPALVAQQNENAKSLSNRIRSVVVTFKVQKTLRPWCQTGTSKSKTYSSGYSHMVTHRSTSPPVDSLGTGERTGSSVFYRLWPYVPTPSQFQNIYLFINLHWYPECDNFPHF